MMLVNGQPAEALPLDDRALAYGDGLFETLAAFDGTCPWFERHLSRLRMGCDVLGLPHPDADALREETRRVAAGLKRAVIKWIVTAGAGGRGYARPQPVQPRRIVQAHPWPGYPRAFWDEGIALHVCHLRLSAQPALAGIKHLNRLEQVLARQELPDGCAEGVLCNTAGEVVEGIASNLFAVLDDTLITPPVGDCGVNGLMRRWVLETAVEAGIDTAIEPLRPDDLERAREIFMTNALIGLWPVRRISETDVPTGPVQKRLLARLLETYPVIDG